MKTTLRIPTPEQYAYVEIEFDKELTPEDVSAEYQKFSKAIKGGGGLDTKAFNHALDRYLTEHTMTADEYGEMNLEQQSIIQCIKRSFVRTGIK